jgi:hypothetical protein
METNLVCIEHTTEQVFSTPEGSEDLRTREGCMKEDTDLCHGDAACQKRGQNHEMKAMNPNQVALIEALNYNIRKVSVDRSESSPKLSFSATVTVNGTLCYIIHTVLGILRVIRFDIFVRIRFFRVPTCLWGGVN